MLYPFTFILLNQIHMMFRIFCVAVLFCLLSCKSTTYYIVRHAEKEGGATMSMVSDPPLSAEGERQALDLKNFLQQQKIKTIYSTNYARTMATAEPTRQFYGITLKMYDARNNDRLVEELKNISDGNVLVVGHSNTVDDIVNGLTGTAEMTDLADNEYGNAFIVKRKGSSYTFERIKVPQTTPRP
jgi:broad specificity phosphatase PhoE